MWRAGQDSNLQPIVLETTILPIELPTHLLKFGAGSGNRTRVLSLEGCDSTIELHLRFFLHTLKNGSDGQI
jgi:hypothetical protein